MNASKTRHTYSTRSQVIKRYLDFFVCLWYFPFLLPRFGWCAPLTTWLCTQGSPITLASRSSTYVSIGLLQLFWFLDISKNWLIVSFRCNFIELRPFYSILIWKSNLCSGWILLVLDLCSIYSMVNFQEITLWLTVTFFHNTSGLCPKYEGLNQRCFE